MTTRARNRVLIYSNSPTAATGYGVQTRHLATMLAADGYEVAVACTWGQQGRLGTWHTPYGHPVTLYPEGYDASSLDVLVAHAEHWFNGRPDSGIIILLSDMWVLNRKKLIEDLRWYNVVAWTPVDHVPTPPHVAQFLQESGALPVAMSKFGQQSLTDAGMETVYAPLGVDLEAYQPRTEYTFSSADGPIPAREGHDIPGDAFVVGMVAMNKDPYDRKGFNEAIAAFAQFEKNHPDAYLYLHTEPSGILGSGYRLPQVVAAYGIMPHKVIYSNEYAYRIGLPPEMMASLYTSFDVLIAPSRGEGFCVPLIEAQACGTPVIASNFTAQTELVAEDGWLIDVQPEWDPTQGAFYAAPIINDLLDALEKCYDDLQERRDDIAESCREFVADYDYRKVYSDYWVPILDRFEPQKFEPAPPLEQVDVIVPLMRPKNLDRLLRSIADTAPGWGSLTDEPPVRVLVVHDTDCAVPLLKHDPVLVRYLSTGKEGTGYADKVNQAVAESDRPWVLVVGDDVEFTDGWFDAAAAISTGCHIIGTNDSEEGRVRNPNVAAGRHADHFFIRRDYIDDEGASLDGPGVAMPTAYRHWYVDREVIELARARGVYGHAADCRIIHHHPGYLGDERARQADPVYMAAVEASETDEATWRTRAPLIEAHRR